MRSLSLEVYETYMAKSAVFKSTIIQGTCIIYNFLAAISKSKRNQVKLICFYLTSRFNALLLDIFLCVCVCMCVN